MSTMSSVAPELATGNALTVDVHDTVAVVTLDVPAAPVNTFTRGVRDELVDVLDRLEHDASIRAAVLISGKRDTWIAGADIEELNTLATAEDAERLSQLGHQLMDRVERLRTPLVAAIDGACMGGGLELALACRYRIVSENPKTVLALPEVQLGLIPGAGGTQRLPRLVGLRAALDMILTGKNVRGKRALQMGLADEMVHPAILREIAVARARTLGEGKRPSQSTGRRGGVARLALDDNPVGRSIVFRQAREQTTAKTRGHYPAPLAALDAVAAGYGGPRERGFQTEARLFGAMTVSAVAKQLIFLFFAGNALKKDPGVPVPPPAPPPRPLDQIAVLGTGFMGAGIAAVTVQQGIGVRFKDTDHGRVLKGLAAVRDVVKERLTRKQITRSQYDDTMSLVSGTIDYTGFSRVGLVIEAVFEDIGVKQAVIREVETVLPPGAIVASNTSTIPIGQLAQASRDPSHVIGMHFFSPVHKMPLLEVIAPPGTARDVVATVVAFGKKIGKTVIVVGDSPGFFANRILIPYLNEAGRLLDEGAAIDAVDKALVSFGFPVGPITLLDEVGIDVGGKAGRIIAESFGPRLALPASLERVLASGRTGRKGRKGFYLYDDHGKKGGVDPSVYDLFPTGARRSTISEAEIQQRTVLAMVNEAARCLEAQIIRTPRDGDVGAVYGIGFPPFRGGPFRYADSVGAATIVQQLEALNDRFPPRFEPANELLDLARRGTTFYRDL